MQLTQLDKGNRKNLSTDQLDFLEKAIPLSWKIYSNVRLQTAYFYGKAYNLSSTLILLDLVAKSDFGRHPLALEREPKSNKLANNLTLIKHPRKEKGKSILWEGDLYRSFNDWDDFSVTFSDTISFKRAVAKEYLFDKLSTNLYNSLIDVYNLENFEIGFGNN
jgi:hypothetical protein